MFRQCSFSLASAVKVSLLIASAFSPLVDAQERTDYDVDKDGLIEIRSIEDFLAIPDAYPGLVKLYGVSDGCPERGCVGYELVTDLDFADRTSVRLPSPTLYGVTFEGNGHLIENLKSSQLASYPRGFFESVYNSVIRNLRVENIDWDAPSSEYLGTLTQLLVGSTVVNVQVSGTLRAQHYTGGLAGVADHSVILGSHFSGAIFAHTGLVEASFGMGGLVGNGEHTLIYASSAEGQFKLNAIPDHNFALGGLIGSTHSYNAIVASHANFANIQVNLVGHLVAQAPMTIESSYSIYSTDENAAAAVVGFYSAPNFRVSTASRVTAVSQLDLACPQSEEDPRCNHPDLFHGWHAHVDSAGQQIWNFGSSTDLPVVSRNLLFDLTDTDGDGVLNLLDRFPENSAAALDFDDDGQPDVWNVACNADCQQASGLTLDDKVELPAYFNTPEQEAEPKGGSLGLIEFWFLVGLSWFGLGRRRLGGAHV